jgi:hypothetical protein
MGWLRRVGAREGESADGRLFHDHVRAAGEVIEVCTGTGRAFGGLEVGDVESGGGIIDLALTLNSSPASLTGWDLNPEDESGLLARARRAKLCSAIPDNVRFVASTEGALPAPDLSRARSVGSFAPMALYSSQVWPLHYREHGSHLEKW